jgi:rare lipoprotein A (peptidoglycan hydrolase)
MRGGTALRLMRYWGAGLGLTAAMTLGVGSATINYSSNSSVPAAVQAAVQDEGASVQDIGDIGVQDTSAGRSAVRPPVQVGVASWYGLDHQGRLTASGKKFDRSKLTAAHPSLPLNTKAKVTNLENGRSVEVTINDRGPGAPGRAIDLSERAAKTIGMKKEGLAPVAIEPLKPAPSPAQLASE